jgi:CBS domain-containing protein
MCWFLTDVIQMLYVREIMVPKVQTIKSNASLKQAASLMVKSRIGSLVVMDGSRPQGILTEGDISRAIAKGLDPTKDNVKSIMSKPVITITGDLRVEEAARVMSTANIKKLPVVEKDKLVGIITQTDIVASSFDLVNTLKEMVRARYRPPDFQP